METVASSASIAVATSNNSSGSGGGASGILLLVILAVLAFPVARGIIRWRRIAKLKDWAKSQGFDFWRDNRKVGKEVGKYLFTYGHGHRAKNVVVMPSRNGTCLYGVMEWKEGRGDKEVTLRGAFVRYDLRAPLPYFLIAPRLSHKVKGITTEWDDFNRTWEVDAYDRRYASAMLSPVMQAFIMDNLHDVMLRIDGPYGYIRTAEYAIEESVEYRALMDDWEDRVVPFLWQDAHLG